MREIKFRGLDPKGKWHVGNLAVVTERNPDVPDGSYISNSVGMPFAYPVLPKTVGQFTGLLDMKGVEIYEGDIIGWSPTVRGLPAPAADAIPFLPRPVFWDERRGLWRITDTHEDFEWYATNGEVVGNIHQTPELLSQGGN